VVSPLVFESSDPSTVDAAEILAEQRVETAGARDTLRYEVVWFSPRWR
jgi:hypothetical protein